MRAMRYAVVLLMVLGLLMQNQARAVDSGDTTMLATAPLLITSYQTSGGGKELQYVELYNNGKTMLNVTDWTIRDVANSRTLLLSTPYTGQIEPGKHVVASRAGVVPQASFAIDGWSASGSGAVMTNLQLTHEGYRALDANLSTKTDDRDKMMTRTYNTDSYSTASLPFVQNYRTTPQPLLFDDGLYSAPSSPTIQIVEIYPYASDCSPFDTSVLCGDYVKLYNPSDTVAALDNIVLRTDSSSSSRTTSNTITLFGDMAPGTYRTIWLTDTDAKLSLTNSGGYVWLEDSYGTTVYSGTLAHYESAGSSLQGYAYALNTTGSWEWTSTPSPDAANVITPPAIAECGEGKYRSPDTGRCRTLEDTINALAACDEGSERNPTTNRCRKIATANTTLAPCDEGQERNPATNRCRSITAASATLTPCDEGYERNPATNRCKKVVSSAVLGAEYPVTPFTQGGSGTAMWWAVGGAGSLAVSYAGWEWRRELLAGLRRAGAVFTFWK